MRIILWRGPPSERQSWDEKEFSDFARDLGLEVVDAADHGRERGITVEPHHLEAQMVLVDPDGIANCWDLKTSFGILMGLGFVLKNQYGFGALAAGSKQTGAA
jgi:hypothetical protein